MSEEEDKKKKRFDKKEYSEVFNTIFGTHIDWTKLTREELIELAVILNHPETFIDKLGVNLDTENVNIPRKKVLKTAAQILKKYGFTGPVSELLEELSKKKEE